MASTWEETASCVTAGLVLITYRYKTVADEKHHANDVLDLHRAFNVH